MGRRTRSFNKNDLSRKRRRKNRGKSVFYLVVSGLIMTGIIFLMRLDFWKIKEVKVGETKRVDGAAISEIVRKQMIGVYWGIFPKNNFLIYPKAAIQKEIADFLPAVLSVEVNAELDHILTVDVKERLAIALWCKEAGECYFMDETGIIFAPALNNNELLKYYGGVEGNPLGKQFGEGKEEFFSKFSDFVSKIEEFGLKTVAVKVVDKDSARLDFEDDFYLLFPAYEKDRGALFANIELFINNLRANNQGVLPQFEYIDARYGNKIFYKIKE